MKPADVGTHIVFMETGNDGTLVPVQYISDLTKLTYWMENEAKTHPQRTYVLMFIEAMVFPQPKLLSAAEVRIKSSL